MRTRFQLGAVVLLAMVWAHPAEAQLMAAPDSAWLSIREALRRTNPQLIAGHSAVAAATARTRAAGSAAPVELMAEVEEGGDMARLDLSRELWSGGRRGAARRVAEADAARVQVMLEIAEARLLTRADQLLLRSATESAIAARLAAADTLLAITEEAVRERFAVANARYSDLLQLRAERLRIQAERSVHAGRAEGDRLQLVFLVTGGAPADSVVTLVDRAIARVTADAGRTVFPDSIALDSLISRNSGVRLADAEVAAAAAAAALASSARRPAVSAAAGVQRYGDAGAVKIGPAVSLGLTLPFTSPGPRFGQVAAGLAQATAAAEKTAAVADARASVMTALIRYRGARQRLTIYDTGLLRGAREEREVAIAAFRTGQLSLLELLDFEMSLTRAEIGRLEARTEATDALADLLLSESGGHDR